MKVDELKLLSGVDIEVSPNIVVHHPKLSEIRDMGESEYYGLVTAICSTPSDYKSILYDQFGIDYEEVSEFEFFLMMWSTFGDKDISILFPGKHANDFQIVQDAETGLLLLRDEETGEFINEVIYASLVEYIREFHGLKKRVDKAGNESTKRYLIKKARKELERRKKDEPEAILAPLVSAMVNCEQFKYNHQTVWDLTIYQFMDSVRRIQKIKNVSDIMTGIYTGNIDGKKLPDDTLNWLGKLK